MSTIDSNKIINPNVKLGQNTKVGAFCYLGKEPKNIENSNLSTIIGDDSQIRSHTIIYAGNKIGKNFQTGHQVFIREYNEIGDDVSIGTKSIIEHHVKIGNNVRIHSNAFIPEFSILEDNCWVGPNVVFTNAFHPLCPKVKDCLEGPKIKKNAKIGANSTLLPGITIGENALVGAGAVVTKDVASNTVVAGNPAKPIKKVDELNCPFNLIDHPYPNAEKPTAPANIPLVDLKVQYQNIKPEIDKAIAEVINNTKFVNGPQVEEFENDFAHLLGVKHAIGVSNGTDAIYLTLKALNLKPGDEIITTPLTFIATIEPICLLNLKPVFVDIDEKTFAIDPEKIEAKITEKTKAIIPVHLHGNPVNITRISAIAKKHNLFLIEDAAQAQGATFKDQRIGSFGDASCFSFFPGKNLGAYGDAGAVVTSSDELAEKIKSLRNHGREKKYTHNQIGTNSRLDTIQAAILNVKLKHLDKWNKQRREVAKKYREKLSNNKNIILPQETENAKSIYHQFVIRVPNRDQILKKLKEQGIGAGIHYPVPLHLQPALKFLNYKEGDLEITEKVCSDILSLPMFPELSDGQIEYITDNLIKILQDINHETRYT